jgi:hypothetical protein
MNQLLDIENKKFLSAKDAGKRISMASDYVSRLCREGKLEGKKIGHAWYVEEDDLHRYASEQMAEKKQRYEELTKKRQEEYLLHVQKPYVEVEEVVTKAQDQTAAPSSANQPVLAARKTFPFAQYVVLVFVALMTASGVGFVFGDHEQDLDRLAGAPEHAVVAGNSTDAAAANLAPESNATSFVKSDQQTASVISSFLDPVKTFALRLYGFGRATFASLFKKDQPVATKTEATKNTTQSKDVSVDPASVVVKKNPTVLLGTSSVATNLSSDALERLLTINADVLVKKSISVQGNATVSGNSVVGGEVAAGSATVRGNARVGGTLNVTGATQLTTLTVSGNETIQGSSSIAGLLSASGGIMTGGSDINAQGGSVFARNIINSLVAGRNITIDVSDPNNPIISARSSGGGGGGASGVASLQGLTGALTFTAGSDITITGLTFNVVSTLETVRARGGCANCITENDVGFSNLSIGTTSTLTTYVNLGASSGESGFGIRASSTGVVEVKNDGGSWSTIGSGGSGITSLNGLSVASQTFASSSAGTDFAIISSGSTHTFQLPSAGASARGLLTASDWTLFNNKISSTSLDTSLELLNLITDETGTGQLVFNDSATGTNFSLASTTLTGATVFANATGTNLSISGVASTTQLVVSGSATSTFANGIQLLGGCYQTSDGSCLTNSTITFISDWIQQTNYGALALTPSSMIMMR